LAQEVLAAQRVAQLPTVVAHLLDQLLQQQAAAEDLLIVQAQDLQAAQAVGVAATTVRLVVQAHLGKDSQAVQAQAVAQITVSVVAEADQAPLVSTVQHQVSVAQAARVQHLQSQALL